MSSSAAIQKAVADVGLAGEVESIEPLSGGCIHNASRIRLSDGRTLVAKSAGAGAAAQFEEEATGLNALADTGKVVVPRALGVTRDDSSAVLLMEHIESAPTSDDAWRRLGEDLADLHAVDVGDRYGFEIDNHLGSTPQPNGWMDDWVEFNREHRFGHQLRLAASSGKLNDREAQAVERLVERLDTLIPRRPKPALLHGDLWSGNALPTTGGRVAVIDPAPYIGDGWADIAMMRLFGGFAASCFDAYAARADDHDGVDQRVAVYQLYHVLNHVNIFGRGYAGQAMSILRRLGV